MQPASTRPALRRSTAALMALLGFLAGSSALLAAAPSPEPATAAPPGDATRGKGDFVKYGCYECHGTAGQGNRFSGPNIAPHPIPYAALIAYIRRPAGQMPSYATAILPDADVADIYAYLHSIPPAKTPASIPALAGVSKTSK